MVLHRLVLVVALVIGGCGPLWAVEGPAAPADHVVLVSIDGLRPEFYLDPSWPAPLLQQLAREGAHASRVRGVFPSVTYPSHTSIVTGVLPSRHGVLYNTPFEPGGVTGRWYWEERHVAVRTLWDAVRDSGGTMGAVGWPVSVGAPITFNMPEVWSIDPEMTSLERLRSVCSPPGLLDEIEREATGRFRPDMYTINAMAMDDITGDAAAYLLQRYRPSLLAVHLVTTDHFQHEDGRDAPSVRRAVVAVDRAVSKLWEAAARAHILDRTAFVILGDHGHLDRHVALAPNVWLAEEGLLEPTPERGDWRAVFHATGASLFLHLEDPEDIEAVVRVKEILDAQPAGVRRLFTVLDREDLERLGAAPSAALALALAPGVDALPNTDPPALRSAEGATHGYLPDLHPHIYTGAIAWGAGIRSGAVASELSLTDFAPLVSHLLGLEMECPDGVLPVGLLDEAP
jgi:hypothetical protein